MKITNNHRFIVGRYYGQLGRRFGFEVLYRHLARLARIVWTAQGFELVARHLNRPQARAIPAFYWQARQRSRLAKLSARQYETLKALAAASTNDDRNPRTQTIEALQRRGLLDQDLNLTNAGRLYLEKST